MTALSMEQHSSIFNKNLHSAMKSSDPRKHPETEENREQTNWNKERLFSPARDFQNTPGEQSLASRSLHQLGMLKFHPYARERCAGPDVFRHLLPYIPPNLMTRSGVQPSPDANSESLSTARFNPFSKAFHGIESENQKVTEKQKVSEQEMKTSETIEKQEKTSDKMASTKEIASKKQATETSHKGICFGNCTKN